MTNPTCSVCGAEMVWREAGISKRTGEAYEGFWGCPTINEDRSYCRGKPLGGNPLRQPTQSTSQPKMLPNAPQSPQTHVSPKTHTTALGNDLLVLQAILRELKTVNTSLEWFKENFVDDKLGTKEIEIPIIG